MSRTWHRIPGCVAAAALSLLLCGCELHGTVDVRSGTEAEADLVFTNAPVDCLGLSKFGGLVVKGVPEPDGNQTCRAQGIIDPSALKDFGIQLTQWGEYLMVDLALPRQFVDTPTQVDIIFPGTVVDGGGTTVAGNRVTLLGGIGGATTNPTKVVAVSHPGPLWWVLALAGGLVAGVALTLASILAVRRARRLRKQVHPDAEPGAVPEPATGSPTPLPPDVAPAPAAVSAPEVRDVPKPARDPAHEAWFAPPPPGEVAAAAGAPGSPAGAPAPPAQRPVGVVDPAHRIWAPPEDAHEAPQGPGTPRPGDR